MLAIVMLATTAILASTATHPSWYQPHADLHQRALALVESRGLTSGSPDFTNPAQLCTQLTTANTNGPSFCATDLGSAAGWQQLSGNDQSGIALPVSLFTQAGSCLKPVQDFYCNVFCSETCSDLLVSQLPSVDQVCGAGCVEKTIVGLKQVAEVLQSDVCTSLTSSPIGSIGTSSAVTNVAQADDDGGPLSGNDEGNSGNNAGNLMDSSTSNAITETIGALCSKDEAGNYCVSLTLWPTESEVAEFESITDDAVALENVVNTADALCSSIVVEKIKAAGCCFGTTLLHESPVSGLALSALSECGIDFTPCSDGLAVKHYQLSSKFLLRPKSGTEAAQVVKELKTALKDTNKLDALLKGIADVYGFTENDVVITGVKVVADARRVRNRRLATGNSAEVDFTITTTDAAKFSSASADHSTAGASAFQTAVNTVVPNSVEAVNLSSEVSTNDVGTDATLNTNDDGLSTGVVVGIVAGALIVAALLAVLVVKMGEKRQTSTPQNTDKQQQQQQQQVSQSDVLQNRV